MRNIAIISIGSCAINHRTRPLDGSGYRFVLQEAFARRAAKKKEVIKTGDALHRNLIFNGGKKMWEMSRSVARIYSPATRRDAVNSYRA